jgi:adenosylcobyric acid synthase
LIAGFIVNRFRGDAGLFEDGYRMIAARTGWHGFGVCPWFGEAWRLPAEDALDIRTGKGSTGGKHIVCLRFSRIANFDDLDPLAQEPGVRLTMLEAGRAIPGDADLVILPGSKSTRGDLAFLRAQGWDVDLQAHVRRGGRVLGLCGGYQMLGHLVRDPEGIEGPPGEDAGLGLLDVETVMTPDKRLTEVRARHAGTDTAFSGYEIHIGRTTGADCTRPFAFVGTVPEGAVRADGLVAGSYLHGMFRDDGFRAGFLAGLGAGSALAYGDTVEEVLDALARHLETHLDVEGLLDTAR